jgi:hypothetical protein
LKEVIYRDLTYNTSVVLEVQEDTVGSLPGLGLSDDNGGVDLLSELGLALLDGGHDHVTDTSSRESVQAGTDTLDGDDVQVSGAGVVCAVHDGATVFVYQSMSRGFR